MCSGSIPQKLLMTKLFALWLQSMEDGHDIATQHGDAFCENLTHFVHGEGSMQTFPKKMMISVCPINSLHNLESTHIALVTSCQADAQNRLSSLCLLHSPLRMFT